MTRPLPQSVSLAPAWASFAAGAAVVAAGAFLPGGSTWALHAPGRFGLVGAALAIAVLAAGFVFARRIPPLPAGRSLSPTIAALAGGLGFGAVAALVHVSTQLLGDGQLIARNFALAQDGSTDVVVHSVSSILAHDHVSPVASLLHLAVVRWGAMAGLRAPASLAAESVLLGVLLGAGLALFARRAPIPPVLRAWTLVLVLLSPTVLLYFGYVENYTAAHLLLGLYALLATASVSGRRTTGPAILVLLLATGLHVQALVWWPSAVFLLLSRSERWRPVAVRALPALATASALAAGLTIAGRGLSNALLPLGPAPDTLSLLSARHVLDWLQTLWLVFPWLPFAAWLWWVRRGFTVEGDGADAARFALADLLVGPALVYLFLLDPVLGAARDWDRAAFLSWGFSLEVLVTLAAAMRRGLFDPTAVRHWLAPTLATGLVVCGSWVALNHSTPRSLARIAAVVEADPHAREHGYEALARYHADRSEWSAAGDWARRAWSASGNPRLAALASQHLRRAGRAQEAIPLLEQALERHPDSHRVRYELVRLVAGTGDCDRTLDLALDGERLHPDEPIYPFFAGDCLFKRGRFAESRRHFERCLELGGMPGESRRYAERMLERIDARTPGHP